MRMESGERRVSALKVHDYGRTKEHIDPGVSKVTKDRGCPIYKAFGRLSGYGRIQHGN